MSLSRVWVPVVAVLAAVACSKSGDSAPPDAAAPTSAIPAALAAHPKWQKLAEAEAGFTNQLVQIRVLMGWRDLANRIGQMRGQGGEARGDLETYGRQIFENEYGKAGIAEQRRQLETAVNAWLDSIEAALPSARWPDGGVADDWQPRAQAKLKIARTELSRWLDDELDPGPLLEQVARVEGWTRGEARAANPFADHDARVLAAVATPAARERLASGADLPTAAPAAEGEPASRGETGDARPLPGEMRGSPATTRADEEPELSALPTDYPDAEERAVPGEMGQPSARPQRVESGAPGTREIPQGMGEPPMEDFWEALKDGGKGPGTSVTREGAGPRARPAPLGAGFEFDTDRPGSDMGGAFDLPSADPNLCRQACRDEAPYCKAFTYVKPGIEGPYAACYMKHAASEPQKNDCCISGLP